MAKYLIKCLLVFIFFIFLFNSFFSFSQEVQKFSPDEPFSNDNTEIISTISLRELAIEKGVDIPIISPRETKVRNPYAWPFAFIAIGLALVLGNILMGIFDLTWSFIPLFIGLGLLFAHFIYRKHSKQDKESNSPKDNSSINL